MQNSGIDRNLKKYIENEIFPLYAKNDRGHGIEHIEEVIRRSFELNQAFDLKLDSNMIYTVAACHDLGKYLDHKKHHLIAAQEFYRNDFFKQIFTEEQREIMRDAIEDHRSSKADHPRSAYGELISSADRNASIRIVFIRSFYVALERMPEMKIEEYLEYTLQRLRKKYDEKDPENMFYQDERYHHFLDEMRHLLLHPEEFKNLYCQINQIENRNITVAEAHAARKMVPSKQKLVFATTNQRKVDDLQIVLRDIHLDEIQMLSLTDIGWWKEIEETGRTCEENAFIKGQTIYQYCQKMQIPVGVLADDSGLFVDALKGEPGIYTARYAEQELKRNPKLPQYECVNKLLKNLAGVENRKAYYQSSVVLILPTGEKLVSEGITHGAIALSPVEPITKPYFYSVFIPDGYQKTFNHLTPDELKKTYRNLALQDVFGQLLSRKQKLKNQKSQNQNEKSKKRLSVQ